MRWKKQVTLKFTSKIHGIEFKRKIYMCANLGKCQKTNTSTQKHTDTHMQRAREARHKAEWCDDKVGVSENGKYSFEREREYDITAATEGEIFTIVRIMTYVAFETNTSTLITHTQRERETGTLACICPYDDTHKYVHVDEKSKSTVYARASMILQQDEKKPYFVHTV